MAMHDPSHIHALIGAARVTITDALAAGITPQILRDIIDGQERAHVAAGGSPTLTYPTNGLAGRQPVTLAVAIPDSAPCDECGSVVEMIAGEPRYRHHVGCGVRTEPYRHQTDAHVLLNKVVDQVIVIRRAYDASQGLHSTQALYRLQQQAETARGIAEILTEDAHSAARALRPVLDRPHLTWAAWNAAESAAMIASQFLGEAKGLARSLRIIIDARVGVEA